jgi:hypothetical protein
MKALENYLFRVNSWARLTKGKLLTLDTPAERQQVVNKVLCDLSPENLTCDGEIRGPALAARKRELDTVLRELRKLDPKLSFEESY